jgi:hypothetical protein
LPLASLIIASEDADQVAVAACTPVAGMTLLEYQVRQARAAGAGHIVVLAARMPQAMMAALDRLARDKIAPDVARSARDAADRVHPDENLLVMADGVFAAPALIQSIATAREPRLLTRDPVGGDAFERIDGSAHWAGLALLDGAMLRETASLLGDWALGPTLLRIAVQRTVARDHLDADGAASVLHLSSPAQANAANQILASAHGAGGGWADRLYGPLGRMLLPRFMGQAGLIEPLGLVPLFMLACALVAGVTGWVYTGAGLFIAAHFPAWIANRLGAMTGHRTRWLDFLRTAVPVTASLLCLAIAWSYYGLSGDRSILSLAVAAALSCAMRVDGKAAVDPMPAMLALLIAGMMRVPDIGFLAVILAGILPAFWRSYKMQQKT